MILKETGSIAYDQIPESGADFPFRNGKVYIKENVAVTGESTLPYPGINQGEDDLPSFT